MTYIYDTEKQRRKKVPLVMRDYWAIALCGKDIKAIMHNTIAEIFIVTGLKALVSSCGCTRATSNNNNEKNSIVK